MNVTVNSKDEAWELIKHVTELNVKGYYCYKSKAKSSYLGYNVYLFGISGALCSSGSISEFSDRLELEYFNGWSMNILIKEQPKKENTINVSKENSCEVTK